MKSIFLALAISIFAAPAIAEEAGMVVVDSDSKVSVNIVNLQSFFSAMRGGTFFPIGYTPLASLYTPIVSFHDREKMELVNLNAGAAYSIAAETGNIFCGVGFRIDNILSKAGAISWLKDYATVAKLPTIEIMVGPVLYGNKIIWGGNLAIQF